jgi:hypothetical protein
MSIQIIYYNNKKYHPNHSGRSKLICLYWNGGLFYTYHFEYFLITKSKKQQMFFVMHMSIPYSINY